MDVSPNDLACLLTCTVRYALGRRSYVVSEVADLLARYGVELRDSERAVICKDIRDALNWAKAHGDTVGMPMDHEVWEGALMDLEAMGTAS